MGQKVNPHGIRVGVIKDWDSRWFVKDNAFGDLIVEDYNIRKMLKAKLVEIKEREHLDKIADIKGVQKEIAWGAQIRSYVFMPYTLAKDHRSGFENGNIQAVMDGDLDGFINAYLKGLNSGTLQR